MGAGNKGNYSSFGSDIQELSSDYLIFKKLKLRTFPSTFHGNLELLTSFRLNTHAINL